MESNHFTHGVSELPLVPVPQLVPSQRCLTCEVCCRFPEADSFLRPYFTSSEIQRAIERGIDPSHFPNHQGSQIEVVPHPSGEGFLCPAFDPVTAHCRIYENRPLDCRLYPFALMWDESGQTVVLGWDLKCPFMVEEATAGHLERLQPIAQSVADEIRALLEREDYVACIADNPQLVTRFQDEVMILGELPLLTMRLRA